MNLCVNARGGIPDGGEPTIGAQEITLDETYVRMNIEAKPIRYVVLSVVDTGTGMDVAAIRAGIFDPFSRRRQWARAPDSGFPRLVP